MNWLRILLCLTVSVAFTGQAAGALKPDYALHGSINLKPWSCMCPQGGMGLWGNRLCLTGLAISGSGPNVWSVDVSNPDALAYESSNGVGFKAYGAVARDGRLYTASWFEGVRIYDMSTSTLTLTGSYDPALGAFWDLDVSNNRAYVIQGTETTSSMHLLDVSNPSNPTQLLQVSFAEGLGGVNARGSYLYFTENHHSGNPLAGLYQLVVYNISDELNPYCATRLYMRHPLSDTFIRGDYLFATWGESTWIGYDGSVLPTAAEWPWYVSEGSQSWASVTSGVLRVNDSSTAANSRVGWSRNWEVVAADGTTTLARARCASAGGDTSQIVNLSVEDGAYRERFRILTDRITALDSGLTYYLDATQWHTYRVTTRNTQFKLYVDENGSPALTGTLTATTTNNRVTFGGGADAATQDISFDYVNYLCREDLEPNINGGIEVYDISNPIAPVLVGRFANTGGGGLCMLGDYLFYTTSGNGCLVVDVSDPLNPRWAAQPNYTGYELAVTGNGRYIYLGNLVIASDEWQGWVNAVEMFTSDPDKTPPSAWSNFSLVDASWDTEYLGEELPSASQPEWDVPGDSTESLASAAGGSLRVNDNSASAKCYWVRNWDATNCRGATVLVRARCASHNANGAPLSYINNIVVEDGRFEEDFAILSDRVRAVRANMEYALDGAQWHTYRITTQGTQFSVYVDEQPTPVLTGPLSSATGRARVWFGSTSTAGLQDIYFDSVQCFSNGVFGPAGDTNDQSPDIKVSVSDFMRNDSISGIDPSTAQYYWSTDGGLTWSPSGWDCRYEADALPTVSSPSWTVAEGSESYGSIVSGYLRVNDDSTSPNTKVKWSRNWGAVPSTGTTVLARARCISTGGTTTYTGNIYVEDGARSEYFRIMTDRIAAVESNHTYMLDGTQWHTYRITTKGAQFKVYVDENPVPVLDFPMTATTSENRVMFGSGASAGTQEIHFDYAYYTSQGDIAPGQSGGAGQPASCTGSAGDYSGMLTASSVPFNQNSEYLNKIKFSMRDVVGNLSHSPVYNVRIDPSAGPRATNVTSTKADGTYTQGATVNVQVTFSSPVIVTYVGGNKPKLRLETGSTDKQAVCTSTQGVLTSSLTFFYQAGAGDTTSDLDYTSIDALTLDGATIVDGVGASADVRLPAPGSAGSLGANKSIAIDAVKPVITNVTSDKADGVYESGESVDVLLMFSEPVNVTGTPQLELETGSVDRKANYLSGSGTAALVFRYAGVGGDSAADLDYKSASSLTLNGGTIKDLAGTGNTATLTLPGPGAGGSLGSNKEIVIIASDGSIASAKQQSIGSTVTLGDKVLYLKQTGFGYIEESDRTCGIRIEGEFDATADSFVCLRGVLRETAGGELYLDTDLVTAHGAGSVAPLGANNRALFGVLTEGLYVTAWGKVLGAPVDNSYFISDGSDETGIKVIVDGTPGVIAGEFVVIRGAAGLDGGRVVYER